MEEMAYISKEEFKQLNERERRLTLGRYALDIGRSGVKEMSERYGVSRNTVLRGIRELQAGETYTDGDRIRAKGGGRPSLTEKYPGLKQDILDIAARDCFIKEGSDKKQLGTSLRKIVAELEGKYHKRFAPWAIDKILQDNGYECPKSKRGKAKDPVPEQQTQ